MSSNTSNTSKFVVVAASLIAAQAFSQPAVAMPGFGNDAPRSSVESCLAEVNNKADFSAAGSVRHDIETEQRRVSGHTMRIRTQVIGIDGDTVVREYATHCAINDSDEIKRFTMRRKGE